METEEEVVEETQTQEETQETSESDNSESVQQTEQVETPKKEPKIWQVVRGIQKSVEDLKTSKQPQTQANVQSNMSTEDIYSLMEHKVPSKHIKEVVKASKVLGMSIQEALEDSFVQARLKTLAEEDQTANATNTGGSKRTTAKITDEQLVQKFMEGKDVDPEAFAQARMNLRKKK